MKTTESNINTNDLEQFKCPNCGGGIEFDSASQQMKCPFCDSEFDMESLKEFSEIEKEQEEIPVWDSYNSEEWSAEEEANVRRYVCQSCAGEIITDATTVASQCPYCGNAIVVASELEGTLRPDLVIPFKVDKNAAKSALNKFLEGKKLLPDCFKDKNHIEEITGIYVPFWLYNCTAEGKAVYSATKVKHWSDSRFHYTKTNHFALHREGSVNFIKVPADGSQKMDDTLMDSLEPFRYEDAVDFKTAYLSGYLAEKYDVTSEENLERVNKRIKQSLVDMFDTTIKGYDTKNVNHTNIAVNEGSIEYALLPLWMLRTKYEGEDYIFAMNGQTGKFVGSLPIDEGKVKKFMIQWTALFTVIMFILCLMFF